MNDFDDTPVLPPHDEPAPMPSPQDLPSPTSPLPMVAYGGSKLATRVGEVVDLLVIRPQDRLLIHLPPQPGLSKEALNDRAEQIYNYICTIKGWPRDRVVVVAGPYQLAALQGKDDE